RDALKEEVRERARQDVRVGRNPAGPQDLSALFGSEAAALGLRLPELVSIYDEAHAAAKPPKPWWTPEPGWTVAGALALLLIFRDWVKGILERLLKAVGEWIYQRVAGHRLFRRKALRKYRQALIAKYS